eukprot:TRINITY_DN20352_c0_g1_i1.p1 TRINITY_DN20352_c0_g1~~TRINITY_DN20352_c0_g1_i1.p1  ORF type:complete len:551 (-),score=45.56 TRINITY_DN20352_c0_g1_i1:651-2303(-)
MAGLRAANAWRFARKQVVEDLAPVGNSRSLTWLLTTGEGRQCIDAYLAEAETPSRSARGFEGAQAELRLASVLDLRGDHCQSLEVLSNASGRLRDAGLQGPSELMRRIATRHLSLKADREKRGSRPPSLVPITRVSPEAMTFEQFRRDFVLTNKPCVIGPDAYGPSEAAGKAPLLTLDFLIKSPLGKQRVALQKFADERSKWAGLVASEPLPFADFVSMIRKRDHEAQLDTATKAPQLFCHSLWRLHGSDALGRATHVPRWFAGVDYLSQAQRRTGILTGSSFPTLFCAAPGSRTGLHVDFLGTHFWNIQMAGQKRWRIVAPSDMAVLRPLYTGLGSMNPIFLQPPELLQGLAGGSTKAGQQDNSSDDIGPTVYEAVLSPGDIIFVPSGWPHQVSNVGEEPSVAIGANFMDESNVEAAISDLEDLTLVEPFKRSSAGKLLSALHGARAQSRQQGLGEKLLSPSFGVDGQHVTLPDFKRANGERFAPGELRDFASKAMLAASLVVGVVCLQLFLGFARQKLPGAEAEATAEAAPASWSRDRDGPMRSAKTL